MISYRATLDVPGQTAVCVSRWLTAHRKIHDRRPWQRAATPYVQAVLVLRWFKDATDVRLLARDAKLSIATAYRYLHEGIDVIAEHVPDLHDVLTHGLDQGWEFVCLDGTLIPTVRSSRKSDAGHDLWYSGKHHRHGGNVQVITNPDGYPEWISPAEPGSTHDITAAREHCLGALYPAAAAGMKTLADKGYIGAGIGILTPIKGSNLAADNHTRNLMINALRAPAERANALLKRTWKALERVTLDPGRITAITAAALVLLPADRVVIRDSPGGCAVHRRHAHLRDATAAVVTRARPHVAVVRVTRRDDPPRRVIHRLGGDRRTGRRGLLCRQLRLPPWFTPVAPPGHRMSRV